MRRSILLAVTSAALVAAAGAASADVTDVIAVPSVAGVLTVTGVGLGAVTAPAASANASIGSTTSIAGSQLTVTDLTGTTAGWDVTATFGTLTGLELGALVLPGGIAQAANLDPANVRVTSATTGALATTNSTAGVASPVLATSQPLTSPVNVADSAGDGRGVTLFNTSYSISLPAKSAAAATLYTGKIVYTVAPGV